MKYLFFDLEKASDRGGVAKVCEFGYTITDEEFTVINEGNLIINPNIRRDEWDYRVVKKILTRKISEYERKPKYNQYYNEIKEMIISSDYIFGHTISGDVKALNDECLRYGLPSIDCEFYDIKEFYKEFVGKMKDVGLSKLMEKYEIEGDPNEHDAEADSFNTMLVFKAMYNQLKMPLKDMIELCPEAYDCNKNYIIESIIRKKEIRSKRIDELLSDVGDNKMTYKRKCLLNAFIDNVKPQHKSNKLQGLKYSISINYEENHYKQMLNIVQILCNLGASYAKRSQESDVFVSFPVIDENGEEKFCIKMKYVVDANADGSNIRIISFEEFLNELGLTNEELDEMPIVSFDCLKEESAVIKDPRVKRLFPREKSTNNVIEEKSSRFSSSIGELFPNLKDILKKED